jgi:hypothetical protein
LIRNKQVKRKEGQSKENTLERKLLNKNYNKNNNKSNKYSNKNPCLIVMMVTMIKSPMKFRIVYTFLKWIYYRKELLLLK